MEAVGVPTGAGLQGVGMGRARTPVAHRLLFPAAALEVGGPCCPPGGEGLPC